MAWNEPGGNDKDPWGSKKGKGKSGGGSPNNKGKGTADIEDITRKMNEKLGGIFGKKGSSGGSGGPSGASLGFIAFALLAAWLATGFYRVDSAEKGVEFRFGAFNKLTEEGLNWKLPYPIDTVEKINVKKQRQIKDRIHMLTQDENIIDLSVTTQYRIKNIRDYLFKVYLPDTENTRRAKNEGTIFQVMRSSLREVAGKNTLDSILTENRVSIGVDTRAHMQTVLDSYGTGLEVMKVNLDDAAVPEEVKAAFNDVIIAQEDLERYIHEAEAYAEQVVPVAVGKASRLAEAAEAYKSQAISEAEGDASRFTQLMIEYQKAPKVTRNRLYLETIESVYENSRKVMVDTKSGNNMLYLPLNQLKSENTSSNNDSTLNPVTSGAIEALRRKQREESSRSEREGR